MSDEAVHKAEYVPTPGSNEALDLGCTCAVLDNCHGRGPGPFWVTGGCPVHDSQRKEVGDEPEPAPGS